MKPNPTAALACLFLLVVYSIDFLWKAFHWRAYAWGVPWWAIALGLAVRFAFMGGLVVLYLRLRKKQQSA
ncbi:MAG TPA: hypothetical protein VGJ06_09970 [Candidatus Acidoferrum sp.]